MDDRLKKLWKFIWYDDSALSWIVNVALAFIIVKFIIYPILAFLLGTSYPVVAVVSCSMEHNSNLGNCALRHSEFNSWWDQKTVFYEKFGINKEEFSKYNFANGFNKGDLMVLKKPNNLKRGDIIVFYGGVGEPIIHRLVDSNNIITQGDNNQGSRSDEFNIDKEKIIGKAFFRIPYLGWFKVWFNDLLSLFFKIN